MQRNICHRWVGLGWVEEMMGWVGLGYENWTHGHVCRAVKALSVRAASASTRHGRFLVSTISQKPVERISSNFANLVDDGAEHTGATDRSPDSIDLLRRQTEAVTHGRLGVEL